MKVIVVDIVKGSSLVTVNGTRMIVSEAIRRYPWLKKHLN